MHAGRTAGAGVGAVFALTAVASVDVVLVLVSRRRAGRPLLRGAPDHLVHRLRRLGVTPQGAVVVVGVTGFAGALVGILIDLGWVDATAALGWRAAPARPYWRSFGFLRTGYGASLALRRGCR